MPGTRKLGKTTSQRMAMLRQQVTDFLAAGRMETTVTRCKEIAPLAEKMISLGKEGGLANYRQALAFITREDVAKKVFDELAPKYADRNGGYTRITRIGARRGDAAEVAVIELVLSETRKMAQSASFEPFFQIILPPVAQFPAEAAGMQRRQPV